MNNYGQIMGSIDKANTAGKIAGALMQGNFGSAIQNGINYALLNRFVRSNANSQPAQINNQDNLGILGNATGNDLQQYAAQNNLLNQAGMPNQQAINAYENNGANVNAVKSALTDQSSLNKRQVSSVANSMKSATGKGSQAMEDAAADRIGQFASQGASGGTVNNIANALGATRGELLGGAGAIGGGLALAGAALAANNAANKKADSDAVAANAKKNETDDSDINKAQNTANLLSDAYNAQAADVALRTGIATGNSGMVSQAQALQSNNQQREMARNAAVQQQAVQNQLGQGSILNGILSQIPGTQQNALMRQQEANQQQLAMQGVVSPGINPYVGGGAQNLNMQGLQQASNYGTQGF